MWLQAQGLWKTPWLRNSQEDDDSNSAGSIYRGMAYSKREMLANALKQGDVAQDVWKHTPGVSGGRSAHAMASEGKEDAHNRTERMEDPLLTEDDIDESTELKGP